MKCPAKKNNASNIQNLAKYNLSFSFFKGAVVATMKILMIYSDSKGKFCKTNVQVSEKTKQFALMKNAYYASECTQSSQNKKTRQNTMVSRVEGVNFIL